MPKENGLSDAVRAEVASVLSSEEIDRIGFGILESNASQDEAILCLQGGDRWYIEIEELLEPEVSEKYSSLGENEWIARRVRREFCFEIAKTANDTDELNALLKKPPKEGCVLAFFMFESRTLVAMDALIEPSRASGALLN